MRDERTMLLPLFPLKTVLFPNRILPLFIFEERYKKMIGDCQQSGQPFGIVLIKSGEEVGASAEPCLVGTMARIIEEASIVRESGEMEIQVRGAERFRILEIIQRKPFLTAEVGVRSEEIGDKIIAQCYTRQVQNHLRTFFQLRNLSQGELAQPSDPLDFSYWLAHNLPISSRAKQDLLEIYSVEERLQKEMQLLQEENKRLEQLIFRKRASLN